MIYKNNLSVCIIARDEISTLPRCVESLIELQAELCIIDTGSIDGTWDYITQVANISKRDLACNDSEGKIVDYSLARNKSINLASRDWILAIDADEILVDGATRYILEAIQSEDSGAVAVEMHSGTTCWPAIRLFRNIPEHRFVGIVHERIVRPVKSVMDRRIKIRNLPDKKNKESSVERDLRLCRRGLQIDPTEIRYALYLARALKSNGQYDEAISVFKKCVELNVLPKASLHSVYCDLAICMLLQQKWDKTIDMAKIAKEMYRGNAQVYCVLGDSYLAMGNVKAAIENYNYAVTLKYPPDDYPFFVKESFFRDYPNSQLEYCNELIDVSSENGSIEGEDVN